MFGVISFASLSIMKPGAYQCTLSVCGSRKRQPKQPPLVRTWTLPVHILAYTSKVVSQQLAVQNDPVIAVHRRVASKLGLSVGSPFQLRLTRQTFTVTINVIFDTTATADVVVNGAGYIGMVISETCNPIDGTCTLQLRNGSEVVGTCQELWNGCKTMLKPNKVAHLTITAADLAYGYQLAAEHDKKVLMYGHSYQPGRTQDDMAVDALIEGCIWASRCCLKRLSIRTDCQAIIDLLNDDNGGNNAGFAHAQIEKCLRGITNVNWQFSLVDEAVNELVATALRVTSTVTVVDWPNMNQFLVPQNTWNDGVE